MYTSTPERTLYGEFCSFKYHSLIAHLLTYLELHKFDTLLKKNLVSFRVENYSLGYLNEPITTTTTTNFESKQSDQREG